MLILENLIGHGAERDCYVHPSDKNLCVKVAKDNDIKKLLREIHIYERIKFLLPETIPEIFPDIIETDKGKGIICRLVRDENCEKNISPNIHGFLKTSTPSESLKKSLDRIIKRIIMRDIFFFDFNFGNFAIQTLNDNSHRAWLVDIKSLNRTGYQGFLHLERIFSPLARIIMFRRIRRFYKNMNLEFNFDGLCRKKFFRNFLVKVR